MIVMRLADLMLPLFCASFERDTIQVRYMPSIAYQNRHEVQYETFSLAIATLNMDLVFDGLGFQLKVREKDGPSTWFDQLRRSVSTEKRRP